jgi:hypothetical protein
MNAGRLHHLRKAVGMLTHGVSASRWAAGTKVIFTVLTEKHRVLRMSTTERGQPHTDAVPLELLW